MSKDCTNPFSELTAEGKPREAYIPAEITDEKELFEGIQTGANFNSFDKVVLQVSFEILKIVSHDFKFNNL